VEVTTDLNPRVEGPRPNHGKREVAIVEVTGVENIRNTAEVTGVENIRNTAEVTGVEIITNTVEDVDEVLMKKAKECPEVGEEAGDKPHPHPPDLSHSPATSSHWRINPVPMHISTMLGLTLWLRMRTKLSGASS
jgi:hypothetical protein